MELLNILKNDENVNIILGDYFIKKSGLPSRQGIAKIFLSDFSDEQKKYVKNHNSFSEVSQAYLDLAIGNKTMLINKLKELYSFQNEETVEYSDFLISSKVDTIISFDYDLYFEKDYEEFINRITLENILKQKDKVNLFKVFGDFNRPENMIITSQDVRRAKALPMYKKYFNLILDSLYTKKTVILGSDLKNNDLLDFIDFVFSSGDRNKFQKIYYLGVGNILTETIEDFIDKYNIETISYQTEKELAGNFKINLDNKKLQLKIAETVDEKSFNDSYLKTENLEEVSLENEIKNFKTSLDKDLEFYKNSYHLEEIVAEEIIPVFKGEVIDTTQTSFDDLIFNEEESKSEIEKIDFLNKNSVAKIYENIVVEENIIENENNDYSNIEKIVEQIEIEIQTEELEKEKIIIQDKMEEIIALEEATKQEQIEEPLILEEVVNQEKIYEEEKNENQEWIQTEKLELCLTEEHKGTFYVETASELKLKNLSLTTNPVNYGNIFINENLLKTVKLDVPAIKVGNELLVGTKVRILGNAKVKFLEIKTREYRIKFSVSISKENIISKLGEFIEYEIYNGLNSKRFKAIVNLFIKIFHGNRIFFDSPGFSAKIDLHSPFHLLRFNLINETIERYEKIPGIQEKNFNQTQEKFRIIHLLDMQSKGELHDSWANLRLDSKYNLDIYKNVKIIRDHEIKLKGYEKNILRETIIFNEENFDENIEKSGSKLYNQKKVKIILEKI